jgi:hypothetical protein
MDRSALLFAPTLTRLESRDSQSSLSATSTLSKISFLIPSNIPAQSVSLGHAATNAAGSTSGLSGRAAIDPIIVVVLPPNLNPSPATASSHGNSGAATISIHALTGLLDAIPVAAPKAASSAPALAAIATAISLASHPTAPHTVDYPPPQPHAPVRVPVG